MNCDIRLSVTFPDNPKVIRLERKLGAQAVLGLVRLWLWASANRPSGILFSMDPEDIEIASRWGGATGIFVATLLDLRLLDPGESISIHDWEEHNVWQSQEKARQIKARNAAKAKWEKYHAQALLKQEASNATAYAPNLPEPTLPEPKKSKTFARPSPEEVTSYGREIGFFVDGGYFCDYYEARGWKTTSGPVKDWKACVRTWKANEQKREEPKHERRLSL